MRSTSSLAGLAGALAGAALGRGAGAEYQFTPIAEAGPGVFDALHGADLSPGGVVVFDASTDGAPAVFRWAPESGLEVIADPALGFAQAFNPVINGAGYVAFAGTTATTRLGIFLVSGPASPGAGDPVVDADGPGDEADLLGQLAIDGDPDPAIAFWSACLGGALSDCSGSNQCIRTTGDASELCEDFPQFALAAPDLRAGGVLAFLVGETGVGLRVVFSAEPDRIDTIIAVGPDGLLSPPSLANDVRAAVFARDAASGIEPGLYWVEPDAEPALAIALPDAGPVAAALGTRPFANGDQDLAWVGTWLAPPEPGVEALFASPQPDPPVLAEGDALLGAAVVAPIELHGFNDARQVLVSVGLDDGRRVLVLGSEIGAPDCPGDLDGDGEVAVLDLIDLILAWGACPPAAGGCAADLTGDCTVDVLDMIQLILSWGACK